jgi:hypothetical protein
VRRHDQTIGRAPHRARYWCILLAVVAIASDPLRAQEAADPGSVSDPDAPVAVRAADPIDLSADRIQVWRSGDEQWVILSGQAAILQGVEGLRAERAVVQIVPVGKKNRALYKLEVYAEGSARRTGRSGPPGRSLRDDFLTDRGVRLKPYAAEGLITRPGPPKGLPLLGRALVPTPAHPRATPDLAPGPAPTPPVAVVHPPVVVPSDEPGARPAAPPVASVPPLAPPMARPTAEEPNAPVDRALVPTQYEVDDALGGRTEELPPPIESPTAEGAPVVPNLSDEAESSGSDLPPTAGPGTDLQPLPGPDGRPAPPLTSPSAPGGARPNPAPMLTPILPGTQRVTSIFPRSGPDFTFQSLKTVDGVQTFVIRGGVVIKSEAPQFGIIDIEADSAIIWRRTEPKGKTATFGPNQEVVENAGQPLEVYLEGNVIIRQDERKIAGNADQKTFRAKRAFYDFRTGRFVGLDAEIDMFAPGLIAPTRVFAPRIDQFRPLAPGPGGKYLLGFEEIRADNIMGTGSRFPKPGYRFTSRAVDITKVYSTKTNPNTGQSVGDPRGPKAPPDTTWRIDARQNLFYLGPVPVFYYPRFVANADDLEPPVRSFIFRTNNYFGQQFLLDLNGFRLLGIQRPQWIDAWNIDVDELTARGLAGGSELGWFGRDIIGDLTDPYRRNRSGSRKVGPDGYFGYFDIWGLRDRGNDVLGSGPAIITNNPAAGKKGFQRSDTPSFQKFRGRVNFRHMQSLLGPDTDPYEDFRLQLEAGYYSDRYFLEEYYKRLNETGLDHETLAYMIRQKENRAWTLWTEANLMPWNTETQWLPRFDYYRLGDSPLANWFTYFQHSGLDYAATHTAVEVNNPNVFAFIPYDPISNTRQTLRAGRFYTNHEVDLPLKLGFLRITPYVQGQLVGWTDQINGRDEGRAWGGAGARADIIAWRAFPGVESELFNIHGLNHKINFEADYRDSWSNMKLNQIGVQDDLDDNTYEQVRRYFAMTQYVGGVLPPQYDPRHLILRRMISPITGTTDVQASLNALQLNLHQRLQTKRGPEGRRRIIDYMTLDLTTTYFPNAARDNFGKSFGQNMYNWQWFVGDRTSLISYGWFEFFDITGQPTFKANPTMANNPFGLNVITSGISISRPPRGNAFIGYTVLDTGAINTSALNVSLSYWLSPKWYGSFANSYDFGNRIPLASMFTLTRVGADYLISLGLVVDPQRNSYMFSFQISPRLSPNIRLGSGLGVSQFDSRYAPTQ